MGRRGHGDPTTTMATEPRSATIRSGVSYFTAAPGPRVAQYAVTLDTASLYRWIPDDTTTTDALNVLAHTGGYAGRWHRVRWDDKGANLTNAAEDVAMAGKPLRVLPLSTLSASRTKTLKTAGAAAGDVIRIVRLDVEAFTMPIVSQASGATIFTFPASQSWFADFRFNGTNWEPTGWGRAP